MATGGSMTASQTILAGPQYRKPSNDQITSTA